MPSLANSFRDLTLSASALTVFDQCARLFRYSYIDQLLWPAGDPSQPEEEMRRGALFHRLVERYAKGYPTELLVDAVDPQLHQWWQAFQTSEHRDPEGIVMTEVPIWSTVLGVRLTARLDRLVIRNHELHIVDWKTERTRPTEAKLRRRWQVKLYPLMVVLTGSQLLNRPVEPEMIRLTLWYATDPDHPFEWQYTRQQFEQDQLDLGNRLRVLKQMAEQDYPLTTHTEICRSCFFRARCYGLAPESITAAQLELFDWFTDLGSEVTDLDQTISEA